MVRPRRELDRTRRTRVQILSLVTSLIPSPAGCFVCGADEFASGLDRSRGGSGSLRLDVGQRLSLSVLVLPRLPPASPHSFSLSGRFRPTSISFSRYIGPTGFLRQRLPQDGHRLRMVIRGVPDRIIFALWAVLMLQFERGQEQQRRRCVPPVSARDSVPAHRFRVTRMAAARMWRLCSVQWCRHRHVEADGVVRGSAGTDRQDRGNDHLIAGAGRAQRNGTARLNVSGLAGNSRCEN
ncbi:hypothetical protein GA0061093_11778 [Rhodococcus qingshengii]|nr:hypothetical protein GA0061093_11778 [Rhodococcus qingshengii]